MGWFTAVVTAALAFGSLTTAQTAPYTRDSISVRWLVPPSGDDLYLQLVGSVSDGWVGAGIGTLMAGALMFVIYPDGSGNVTVSPRLGTGHVEPKFESSIQFQLLGGSGVSGDTMTANVKCSNCRKWSGGSVDVTSRGENCIWATGGQKGLSSTNQGQSLRQHSTTGHFAYSFAGATITGDTDNPFTSDTATTTGSSPGNSSIIVPSSGGASPKTKADKVLIAHGSIMAVTFILFFPLGAAVIRLLNNRIPNALAIHRGLQTFNFALAIIGLGMGIWRSEISQTHFLYLHQTFGVVIVSLILAQAALGSLHHTAFLKTQKRSVWSYAHIWLGRFVIVAGITNGGIGLRLNSARQDVTTGAIVAYSVVAALVGVVYIAFYLIRKRGGGKRTTSYESDGVGAGSYEEPSQVLPELVDTSSYALHNYEPLPGQPPKAEEQWWR